MLRCYLKLIIHQAKEKDCLGSPKVCPLWIYFTPAFEDQWQLLGLFKHRAKAFILNPSTRK